MSGLTSIFRRRIVRIFIALILLAAAFRLAVAHWLPNDGPDDGRTYAQIARNLLEQHVYSHETEAPYDPSLIRLPGYPLFLASIYSVFGHTSNGAVRIVQALIDAATCGLVALLAFFWQPDETRKRTAAIAALALAAVCPFTTIYAATILTEVPTTFLVLAMSLAATLAFRKGSTTEDEGSNDSRRFKRALLWWLVAGLCGGLAVLFRPDSGLFVAAVGLTLVITAPIWRAVASAVRHRFGSPKNFSLSAQLESEVRSDDKLKFVGHQRRRRFALPAHSTLTRTLAAGSLFTFAFVLVLAPWTIRNARVFHLFQPLSPSHGEMPGEFVPRGYNQWLRTWLDDESYVSPFLWSLDSEPIDLDDVPPSSFDSAEEKARVGALLDKYNDPQSAANAAESQPKPTPTPQASPKPTPLRTTNGKTSPTSKATPSPANQKNANANSNANAEAGDQNDNSGDQGDESDNADESDQSQAEEHGAVEMTPEIDAGFAQIAAERIARHPFRYYVWLPLKRAHTMWFDTHSQYWPFEGTLLPLEDLDYEHHQQIWLPLFAGLTGIYTVLGLAGAWLLWDSRQFAARRWLLLVSLAIVLRLILFSSLENPEPRYLVEFFPFLAVLGGIAIARLPRLFNKPQMNAD
jgi:4-amino-4-deoxy-L-arabinose transferase-like glycosyltransferase